MGVHVLFSWADSVLLDLLYLLMSLSMLYVFVLIVVFLMAAAIQVCFGIVRIKVDLELDYAVFGRHCGTEREEMEIRKIMSAVCSQD